MNGKAGFRRRDSGFTLLEVMVAAVVMAIIFMGLVSSITGSFLATDMANKATEAQATARTILEEALDLAYGDALLLDGNALVTEGGLAGKYSVYETAPGLLTSEVQVCRPMEAISSAELSAMTMEEFEELRSIEGSRISFTTLSTGLMARASVTDASDDISDAVVDTGGNDNGSGKDDDKGGGSPKTRDPGDGVADPGEGTGKGSGGKKGGNERWSW